jgi:xanthine dehydrogenase YagR molybdenum-binding subunit
MGLGMALLEHHSYDPKLGLPSGASIERSRLPTWLDVPPEIGWGAVDIADPSNPVGVKGVAEPALGSGASAITSAVSDALGGVLLNRTPILLDMILNTLSGRPQSVKPLQLNV